MLPVTLLETSGCGTSRTREKVLLSGLTESCKVWRRDRVRGGWGSESSTWERWDPEAAFRAAIRAETSDVDLECSAVGRADPAPDGLATRFAPETLSSRDLANEKRGAVADDDADPWPSEEGCPVTSSRQLVRLACPASLLA